jgi:hypothetical protein
VKATGVKVCAQDGLPRRVGTVRSAWACGRAIAAGIVLGAMLSGNHARADDDAPAPLIRYSNDALTVRLSGVQNSDVLEELARQSGAEIRGQVLEPHEISADFESVPLPEALARLLGEQNFALVYGKGGRLKAVRLLGGSQVAAEASASRTTTTSPSAPGAPSLGALPELIDRYPPVPVAGKLADALGTQSATLRQLLDLSLHHGDADVRAEAVRTGITALEAQPDLRTAVIKELNNADSAFLTTLLRASASEQAEDAATQVFRDATMPDIRLKASTVLQRLRAGGAGG